MAICNKPLEMLLTLERFHTNKTMADSKEEFEALFDYRRVQPPSVVHLDDDELDVGLTSSPKRRKVSNPVEEKNGKGIYVLDDDDDDEEKENEDWLSSPPKISRDAKVFVENSTLKELRLKKQELLSVARSAEDELRDMEEFEKREVGKSLQSSLEGVADKASKQNTERTKIVISVQDKDGPKLFRIYMDDKFERLFKLYADKVKLELQNLVFCFDGDKLAPGQTPESLGMEDNDMIEVHIKSS